MQSPPWPAWLFVAIGIMALLSIYLNYRWVKAKTRIDYITCTALFIGLSLAVMVVVPLSGVMPSVEEIERRTGQAPTPPLPMSFILAFAIWFIGGNYIVMRQLRKAGRPWWHIFNPFSGFMQLLDGKSWLAILILAFVSLAIAMQGLHDSAVNPSPPPTRKSP